MVVVRAAGDCGVGRVVPGGYDPAPYRDGIWRPKTASTIDSQTLQGTAGPRRRDAGRADDRRRRRQRSCCSTPQSGVDVAFMQGGVAPNPEDGDLVCWRPVLRAHVDLLLRRRSRLPRSTNFVSTHRRRRARQRDSCLLRSVACHERNFNGQHHLQSAEQGRPECLDAGRLDAASSSVRARTPAFWEALHYADLKFMSNSLADAYASRFLISRS